MRGTMMKGGRRPLACLLVCVATSAPGVRAQTPDPALTLAQSRNCLSCHSVSRDFMGPSFQHVAERYANVPDAHKELARKIAEGGVGVWGVVPMSANTQVTPDQASALAQWILSLK